jgi:hypothetical protein
VEIEVERVAEDKLARQVWAFSVLADWSVKGVRVRLTEWREQQRQTYRHKWEPVGEAYRHRQHNGHHHCGFRRPAAEVPVPEDVLKEVKLKILQGLDIIGAVDPVC